jgi:hypothetical protein
MQRRTMLTLPLTALAAPSPGGTADRWQARRLVEQSPSPLSRGLVAMAGTRATNSARRPSRCGKSGWHERTSRDPGVSVSLSGV